MVCGVVRVQRDGKRKAVSTRLRFYRVMPIVALYAGYLLLTEPAKLVVYLGLVPASVAVPPFTYDLVGALLIVCAVGTIATLRPHSSSSLASILFLLMLEKRRTRARGKSFRSSLRNRPLPSTSFAPPGTGCSKTMAMFTASVGMTSYLISMRHSGSMSAGAGDVLCKFSFAVSLLAVMHALSPTIHSKMFAKCTKV